MNTSWDDSSGRLECHWTGVGDRVSYRAPWMEEAREVAIATAPDFTRQSPLSGAGWFAR